MFQERGVPMEIVKDRVVLIAGATDEIGEAIALRLARGGAKIAVGDSDSGKVEGLAAKLKGEGADATGVVFDGTKSDEVKRAVGEVTGKFGKIDILINNLDSPKGKGIIDLTEDEWKESFENNLNPLFFLCKEVAPKMKDNKYGRIINISSVDYLGWPGKANYSASKSGILGFTRSLALELAINDIMVNTVATGDIKLSALGLSEEKLEKMAGAQPVKRLGTPEDVAYAVAFFASDTQKYVTGQTLFVCGGKSIHFSMSI